jgi:hypothetical protein
LIQSRPVWAGFFVVTGNSEQTLVDRLQSHGARHEKAQPLKKTK